MESKIAKLREGERKMNDSFQGQYREEDMKRHWSKGAKFQFCKVNKFWRFKACIHACSVTQLSPTLCDPKDCVSSVHGIILARILEWVAISSSRRSSWPRAWTQVSCIAGRFFTVWATREALIGYIPIQDKKFLKSYLRMYMVFFSTSDHRTPYIYNTFKNRNLFCADLVLEPKPCWWKKQILVC